MADNNKALPPKKRYTRKAKESTPSPLGIETNTKVVDNTAAPITAKEKVFEDNKKNLVKQSNWFLTLNSNKRLEGDSPEAEQWMHSVQLAMDNPQNWIKFMIPEDKWDAKSIISADVEISHEIGGKYHQLHSHCIIKIKHRSSIQVDRHKLKVAILEHCPFNGAYVDSKLFYDPTISLQNYIRKQQEQAREYREALAKGKEKDPEGVQIVNEPPPVTDQDK